MKLFLVLISVVASLANAMSVPEISVDSQLGRNLLAHARRLDENANEEQQQEVELSWVASYSVKFVRLFCALALLPPNNNVATHHTNRSLFIVDLVVTRSKGAPPSNSGTTKRTAKKMCESPRKTLFDFACAHRIRALLAKPLVARPDTVITSLTWPPLCSPTLKPFNSRASTSANSS